MPEVCQLLTQRGKELPGVKLQEKLERWLIAGPSETTLSRMGLAKEGPGYADDFDAVRRLRLSRLARSGLVLGSEAQDLLVELEDKKRQSGKADASPIPMI